MQTLLRALSLFVCCCLPAVCFSSGANKELTISVIVTDHASEVFDHWENPDGKNFSIPVARVAERGKFLAAVVLFKNCRPNAAGNCNVDLNIQALDPLGKVYGDMKDAELWWDKRPPSPGFSQLGHEYMGLTIEPKDSSGTYKVLVTVHDRNSGETVHAQTSFVVK